MLIHFFPRSFHTWNASTRTAKFCVPPAYCEQSQRILHACTFEPFMLYNLTLFILQQELWKVRNVDRYISKKIGDKGETFSGTRLREHWWFEGAAPCLTWSLSALDTGYYLIGCHHLWARRKRDRLMINETKGKNNLWQNTTCDLVSHSDMNHCCDLPPEAAKDLLLLFQTQMGF